MTSAAVVTSSPVVGSSKMITSRLAGEGHRDGDALELSSRELVRIAPLHAVRIGHAHRLEQVARPMARRLAGADRD